MNGPTHAEIRLIRSLSQKKFRDETGLFVVEGEKMVAEAERSAFAVEKVYRKDEIGAEAMSRISRLSSPSPVLALVRKPAELEISGSESMLEVIADKGLYLALDGIRDPGNLGTILRIADWFGVDAVLASPDTVELLNPKVVQATMGAVFRVRFRYCDLVRACRSVRSRGGSVYGTHLDGVDLYSEKLETGGRVPAMIVIGNESGGVSPAVTREVSRKLFIPAWPRDRRGSESLNAAVATAVVLAEFRRRGQVRENL